ncbi:MAG: hypothetical protein ACM338_04275 [Betaproteobacteria bacterium]
MAADTSISADNRFTDTVAERFDIGERLGGDVAKDMIAVRIAPDLDESAITFAGYHAYYASRRASLAVMLVVEALRQPEDP